jgi:hypothetical protein
MPVPSLKLLVLLSQKTLLLTVTRASPPMVPPPSTTAELPTKVLPLTVAMPTSMPGR